MDIKVTIAKYLLDALNISSTDSFKGFSDMVLAVDHKDTTTYNIPELLKNINKPEHFSNAPMQEVFYERLIVSWLINSEPLTNFMWGVCLDGGDVYKPTPVQIVNPFQSEFRSKYRWSNGLLPTPQNFLMGINVKFDEVYAKVLVSVMMHLMWNNQTIFGHLGCLAGEPFGLECYNIVWNKYKELYDLMFLYLRSNKDFMEWAKDVPNMFHQRAEAQRWYSNITDTNLHYSW